MNVLCLCASAAAADDSSWNAFEGPQQPAADQDWLNFEGPPSSSVGAPAASTHSSDPFAQLSAPPAAAASAAFISVRSSAAAMLLQSTAHSNKT